VALAILNDIDVVMANLFRMLISNAAILSRIRKFAKNRRGRASLRPSADAAGSL
jgi:hypothetical protein